MLCTLNVSLLAGSLPSVYKHAHISKTRKVKNTLLLALTSSSGHSSHLLLLFSPPPFRKWTQDPLLGNMPATLSCQVCTPPPCTCGALHPPQPPWSGGPFCAASASTQILSILQGSHKMPPSLGRKITRFPARMSLMSHPLSKTFSCPSKI